MFFSVRENRQNEVVFRETDAMPTRIQQVFRRGFLDLMRALKKRANHEILHGKKTGRVYRVRLPSGRMKRHQSSAPGETHANLTGRLRRSLSWKVHGWDRAEFGYGVAVTEGRVAPIYAPFVEFGTGNMWERPSLLNAIEAEAPEPHFDRAFDKEFR